MKIIILFIALAALSAILSQAATASDTAECSVSIDKERYELGEKVSFKPEFSRPDAQDESDTLKIQYWVEYTNGTIAKKAVNTSSTAKKLFTPKKEATYVIWMVAGNYCNASEEIRVGNPANVSEISESTATSEGGPSQNIELSISIRGLDSESGDSSLSGKDKPSKKETQTGKTVQQAEPKSKAASLVIWFLLFLLTVFCVVLIWRR